MKKKQKLDYAFWPYDQFPFFLWGAGKLNKKSGDFQLAHGYHVKPLVVLPSEQAEPIIKLMLNLKHQRLAEIEKTHNSFMLALTLGIPEELTVKRFGKKFDKIPLTGKQ